MKLNFKSVSIILAILVVTSLIVFSLTRGYYTKESSTASEIASAPANSQAGPSTQDLIDSLQNYPRINPSNDPNEIDQQANQAFEGGDYATAAELYQRIINLSPNEVEPHNNLGLTLHYLGRSAEALEVLKRGIELQPEFQRIWLTLGFVQGHVGHSEEAREAFKRAIELGPETGPGKSASEMLNKIP